MAIIRGAFEEFFRAYANLKILFELIKGSLNKVLYYPLDLRNLMVTSLAISS